MTHEKKDQNRMEYIQSGRSMGEWWDHSTNPDRYEEFSEVLPSRFDYSDREELRIVDVGSSTGEPVDRLASHLEDVYGLETYVIGIDVGDEPLREALEEDRIDEGRAGRVQDWQPDPDSYDIAVSKTLFPQIDPWDQSRALDLIETAVRPGGAAALQIDPYGKDIFKGFSYVFSGEELSEVSEETDRFREYPLDGPMSDFRASRFLPESEQDLVPDHEFYDGYLGGMRAELDELEEDGTDVSEEDIIER